MYPNWTILLHLSLACWGVGAQIFAQPLPKNHGALAIQRAEGQMIEEAALQQHLQQITGSEALAPLLLNLLGQNVPNWQQQQIQQQLQPATNQPQPPQAQFFVYNKNSPAGSQQPPILAAFNGVNVQPEQQQLPLARAPAEAQYPATAAEGPKIVKAPPAAVVWAPESRHP
ncbi:hypothetical protein KR067_001861, partial [Drosophila pandora]